MEYCTREKHNEDIFNYGTCLDCGGNLNNNMIDLDPEFQAILDKMFNEAPTTLD